MTFYCLTELDIAIEYENSPCPHCLKLVTTNYPAPSPNQGILVKLLLPLAKSSQVKPSPISLHLALLSMLSSILTPLPLALLPQSSSLILTPFLQQTTIIQPAISSHESNLKKAVNQSLPPSNLQQTATKTYHLSLSLRRQPPPNHAPLTPTLLPFPSKICPMMQSLRSSKEHPLPP